MRSSFLIFLSIFLSQGCGYTLRGNSRVFFENNQIRFFLGYSGWGTEQLESEIKEQSWFIGEYNEDLITSNDDDDIIWRKSIELLGSEFKDIARFPIDPSLN